MNVNRRSWMTTDDYLAEKEGMQRANSLLKSTASVPQFGTYQRSQFARPAPAGSLQRNQATVQAKNPTQPFTAPAPQTVLNVGQSLPIPGSKAEDTAPDEQPLTQQQVNAQLTTAYTFQQMNEALQSIIDFNNRKFKYNAKESPLYTILEQQAAEEARLASGRAYARSVANTGGYGSSYATLAAEEASRQVMEGKNDQQYALYQAAKDEFEAERQSRLDWYNMMKQFNADAMAKEEYEKLRAEEEARAASGVSEDVAEASALLLSGNFTEYSEGTMRALLETTGQYDEATINAALEQARKAFRSGVSDSASNVADISTAVTYKGELDAALRNKTMTVQEYDKAIRTNSQKIMAEVNKGLERLEDMDHAALGYTDEEWSGMDDGDKKLAIFDSVGQMVKAGAVTHSDYYKMLYNDLQGEFNSEEYKKSKTQLRDAMDSAIIIQDLYDNGYLLQDEYTSLMYREIYDKIKNDVAIETIDNYDKEWKTMKGEPLSASAFFKKIESGKYLAPGITTTSAGAVKNFSEEEKELLLDMIRKKRDIGNDSTFNKPEKKGAT